MGEPEVSVHVAEAIFAPLVGNTVFSKLHLASSTMAAELGTGRAVKRRSKKREMRPC